MVGPIGGGSSPLIRQDVTRRSSTSDTARAQSSNQSTNRSLSLNELRQVDSPSPISKASSTSFNPRANLTHPGSIGNQPLQRMQKKGAPDLELTKEVQPFASAAQFLYSNSPEHMPEGWRKVPYDDIAPMTAQLDFLHLTSNGTFTSDAGLNAKLFQTQTGELCLAFAGRDVAKEPVSGFKNTMKQWFTDAKNIIRGKETKLNNQALRLTSLIAKQNPDKNIILTGHGAGGSRAQFVAAIQGTPDNPLKCYTFCSAELGQNAQIEIKHHLRNNQESYVKVLSEVKNFKIKGDPFPNMHYNFTQRNLIGQVYTIPSNARLNAQLPTYVDSHVNFLGHIDQHIQIEQNKLDNTQGEQGTWF